MAMRTSGYGKFFLKLGVIAPLIVTAAACSSSGNRGGGGSVATPPSSPPPPPPPPTPAEFETDEYFDSGGLATIGASSAYAAGATGAGVTVAVIDSGVDATHPDLIGQVSSLSIDLFEATRASTDFDPEGHGTSVSGVIAARQNGEGVLGTAFESQILDIRADRENTCSSSCSFSDPDLVDALEYAVANGAQIINMSLGGRIDGNPILENAVFEAAAAGALIVVSAGNDGDTMPDEPAYVAGDPQALGRVVAVGAIDPDRNITDFSNRAGDDSQNFYILAPGDFIDDDNDGQPDRGVRSTGLDDDIVFPGDPINDADDVGDYYFVSGTSFAAPHVSGALALVLDAFPNLEPEEALDLLLSTADDYVDPNNDAVSGVPAGVGVDSVSGVGILNLEAAFSPQGTSSLSFQTADTVLSVPVAALAAPASGAFGDWARASGAFSDLVFQDSYARGFRLGEIDAAPSTARFQDFDTRARFHEGDWGGVAAGGFSMDWFTPAVRFDPAAPYTPDPETSFTTRFAFSGGEVQAGRGSTPERIGPSLSLVSNPTTNATELGGADAWAMVAHDIGPVRAQAFSETSEGRDAAGVAVVEDGDNWTVRAAFVSERDETSSLGAAVQSRFGLEDGMRADALRLEGAADVSPEWTLRAMVERADAELEGLNASGIWTSAWAVAAERPLGGGVFSLSLAQPRRAEGGDLSFNAPVEFSAAGDLTFETRTASLTPSGRELDLEARWRTRLSETLTFETSAALVAQPHHVADADTEAAMWVGLRTSW